MNMRRGLAKVKVTVIEILLIIPILINHKTITNNNSSNSNNHTIEVQGVVGPAEEADGSDGCRQAAPLSNAETTEKDSTVGFLGLGFPVQKFTAVATYMHMYLR